MQPDLLPLHSYFSGDAFCTVVVANAEQTVAEFAESVADMVCGYRVDASPGRKLSVSYNGAVLDPKVKIRNSGLKPFERVDILCD